MSIAAMGWVVQISYVHQKYSLDLMKKQHHFSFLPRARTKMKETGTMEKLLMYFCGQSACSTAL